MTPKMYFRGISRTEPMYIPNKFSQISLNPECHLYISMGNYSIFNNIRQLKALTTGITKNII
jgi:hypothetical protein